MFKEILYSKNAYSKNSKKFCTGTKEMRTSKK